MAAKHRIIAIGCIALKENSEMCYIHVEGAYIYLSRACEGLLQRAFNKSCIKFKCSNVINLFVQ